MNRQAKKKKEREIKVMYCLNRCFRLRCKDSPFSPLTTIYKPCTVVCIFSHKKYSVRKGVYVCV